MSSESWFRQHPWLASMCVAAAVALFDLVTGDSNGSAIVTFIAITLTFRAVLHAIAKGALS